MTNKVKPFYIRITDDMTPQMVQDAFDKCVSVGARALEAIKETETKIRYQSLYPMHWDYFGVDYDGDTLLSDEITSYSEIAKEITLDQLDEWLGIAESSPKQVEWKNGDECVFDNKVNLEFSSLTLEYLRQKAKVHYRFKNSFGYDMLLIEFDDGYCCAVCEECVSKPETPEQKSERERLEEQDEARKNALLMLDEVSDVKNANVNIDCTYAIAVTVKAMIELGYRKQ